MLNIKSSKVLSVPESAIPRGVDKILTSPAKEWAPLIEPLLFEGLITPTVQVGGRGSLKKKDICRLL